MWPRIRWPFREDRVFYARTTRHTRFFWFGLRATPFLGDKKGGKEPSGGFVDFLSMKIDSNHTAKTNPYKKGARGPRIEAGLKLEPKG